MAKKKFFRHMSFWLILVSAIGLFSIIILTSRTNCCDHAYDARIKSALIQVMDVAQREYLSQDNSYATICAETGTSSVLNIAHIPDLQPLREDIISENGGVSEICWSSNAGYCVKAQLKIKDKLGYVRYFCVDSTGDTLMDESSNASFCNNNNVTGITCAMD